MTQQIAADSTDATGFDRPLLVQMVQSFFLVLLGLTVLEMGIRFGLVVLEFENKVQQETEIAAKQLAEDVKSIMLNSGGPVAARTVYPIMRNIHRELGLFIAIEPSEATVSSIVSMFDFSPEGIPRSSDWPRGKHHESTVSIIAEEFCIGCHVEVEVGGVLGKVTVRSYFSTYLSQWWEEVRINALLVMGKVILNTIILYLLLQMRMAPLTSLRSTVAALAKADADISHRAKVETRNEFGELAHDLNLFLDRAGRIVAELSTVLSKLDEVPEQLNQTRGRMGGCVKSYNTRMGQISREVLAAQEDRSLLLEEWLRVIETVLSLLQELSRDQTSDPAQRIRLESTGEQLQEFTDRAKYLWRQYDKLACALIEASGDLHELSRTMESIAIQEEKLRGIAETSLTLLRRFGKMSE